MRQADRAKRREVGTGGEAEAVGEARTGGGNLSNLWDKMAGGSLRGGGNLGNVGETP